MRNNKIIQQPEERNSEILKKYFKSINKFPVLTTKEERELCLKALNGDEMAREKLIECNLKLVISIAKRYQGYGMPLIDLIEEGNSGLILSVDHYNIEKKTKFSTCASWWIKHAIKKALTNDSRTIRIPLSQYIRYKKINEYINCVEQETQAIPDIDNIVDSLGFDKRQIEMALLNSGEIVSDIPNNEFIYNNNRDQKLDNKISVEENTRDIMLSELIDKILSKMSKKEEFIIKKIFGIGCKEMVIKEIANELGISYERVRQIKRVALAKLKQRYPNLKLELYND